MRLQQIIDQHWYHKPKLGLTIILWPLSLGFALSAAMRRCLFKLKLKRTIHLPVPVVVIGNISVGGAGKTPLTKALAQQLQDNGYPVGIILRGYKGSNSKARVVNPLDSSLEVGDEALIYAKAGFPVAISPQRVAAGTCLLQHYPQLKIIIADDGLQHYQLARDLEICVIDQSRMFGNHCLLPMGPLREPLSRLKQVDAIVVNGTPESQGTILKQLKPYSNELYFQHLQLLYFYNPQSGEKVDAAYFAKQKVQALAGIGNPQRFFKFLADQGIIIAEKHKFPDHYHYQAQDLNRLNPEYAIITTEKDYTKLAALNCANIWIAMVAARLNNSLLYQKIITLIK